MSGYLNNLRKNTVIDSRDKFKIETKSVLRIALIIFSFFCVLYNLFLENELMFVCLIVYLKKDFNLFNRKVF